MSLALSADETQVAAVGDTVGGSEWITALYDTSTGIREWLVIDPNIGTAAKDVVMDAGRVYVTGLGVTDPGTFRMKDNLTVVAYDRIIGVQLWRKNKIAADGTSAYGIRMALAPDGSVVVTGVTNRGFLDWYTVAFEITGVVRWEVVRDAGLNTDEFPVDVLALPNGTVVVTGKGGPPTPEGFGRGVTAGYSPAGTPLWEGWSPTETVWATALPSGDVVAAGGQFAYAAAFRPPGTTSGTMHIADLDATAVSMGRTWTATVTATVRDDGAGLVEGAIVSGTWKRGTIGTCTTGASGTCSTSLAARGKSEQFTVTGVTHASLTYDPTSNTDPDGDSNGTVITIRKP